MGNQYVFLAFCIASSQFACQQKSEETREIHVIPPKIVAARTFIVPHKTLPPEVLPLTGLKRTIAGSPQIVDLKTNISTAKPKQVVPAGTPEIIIQTGLDRIPPENIRAIDSPFLAGRPEVILLKDFTAKGNNWGNFSFIKAVDGLHSNEISSLCQDNAGNLWIGSWWGGVSKYDGRYLTNYSVAQGLSSDDVASILADSRGNIWIATMEKGINKFDGKYITQYSERQGFPGKFTWNMLEDKNGNIWFASGTVVSKFDGKSFVHYSGLQGLDDKGVMSVFQDSKGNVWVGGSRGLSKFDEEVFVHYTPTLNLNDSAEVLSITEDAEGNIWFTTNYDGLFKYDGDSVTQYTVESGLSSNRLTRIIKDWQGYLWIGTWGYGLNRFDGKSFTRFDAEEGLDSDQVPAIFEDASRNLWLATTAGLCRYDGKLFSSIIPLHQSEVESLLADSKSNIWIGAGAGSSLNKYNGNSIARYTNAEGLANTNINQIIEDNAGNIWFGHRAGADKFDGKYFTHYSKANGLIDNTVFCLLEDRDGNIWFGTENGLSKFDGKHFTNYSVNQGLLDATIYSLYQDSRGTIWIGTSSQGVCTFDGKSFTHYDMKSSLSHPTVLGMSEDNDGNMWFCTSMGVNKFDGKHFTWYTTAQGLTNNIVKNVLHDRAGNMWVGTINGINRLNSKPDTANLYSNIHRPLFQKYTSNNGFAGGGTYENSITQDLEGKIWIGATDRVSLYHPEGDIPDTIPPNVYLTGVSLFNQEISWVDVEKKKHNTIILNNGSRLKNINFTGLTPWYHQPENLTLNYDNNYIRFQFVGIKTYKPREVRYRYILAGFDKKWSSLTDNPEATYSNLPHGNYTLKVQAVNSAGYWSNELNYSFKIFPPLWLTWWAYLVYASAFVISVWLWTLYRLRRLTAENIRLEEKIARRTNELRASLEEKYKLMKKVEGQEALLRERLRISRELHDDIGSTLGSISIYSEVAKNHTAKKQNATEVLSKIGNASRELIDKMNDIVWSLNPANDSVQQLHNRMTAFTAMILTPQNIHYEFTADRDLKTTPLNSEKLRNIFLIFKESLHNVVKYASCEKVWIDLAIENDEFVMTIQDDGQGIVKPGRKSSNGARKEKLGGNGLNNMKVRAENLNGRLTIQSTANKGTTIQLIVPV